MSADEISESVWSARLAEITAPPYLLGAGAVLKAASDRTEFLVDRAIPQRAISFLVGRSGGGKSWLAYALAMAAARGLPWLGIPQPARQGPVLILNYDNPTKELGRRMRRMGMTESDPIYFHSPDREALLLPKHGRELAGLAEKTAAVLVVVDSFRQAHTSNENDSAEMAIVMNALKGLYAYGAAVVVVHHTSKNTEAAGVDAVRGSVEIVASADAVIKVWQNEGSDLVTWDKHRGWRLDDEDKTFGFAVKDQGKGCTVVSGDGADRSEDPEAPAAPNPDELEGAVAEYLAERPGATATEIARELHAGKARVIQVLATLRAPDALR